MFQKLQQKHKLATKTNVNFITIFEINRNPTLTKEQKNKTTKLIQKRKQTGRNFVFNSNNNKAKKVTRRDATEMKVQTQLICFGPDGSPCSQGC